MKEIHVHAGDHIQGACERLVQEAPAFLVFNEIRLEAQKGDSVADLRVRYSAELQRACDEQEKKRRAYEQTPAGRAQLARAQAAEEAEKSIRAETLAAIDAYGIREKYPWVDGMGEISGFGGGYEQACRNMLYAGLMWLDVHNGPIDEQALSKAVAAACPDSSGAMHGAAMAACYFIQKNGWARYVEEMSRPERP